MRQSWEKSSNPEKLVLWAISCTAFFGFFRLGELLAPSTQKSYNLGMKLFFAFCECYQVFNPFPVTEQILYSYATLLADEGLSHHLHGSCVLHADLTRHQSLRKCGQALAEPSCSRAQAAPSCKTVVGEVVVSREAGLVGDQVHSVFWFLLTRGTTSGLAHVFQPETAPGRGETWQWMTRQPQRW